jgi:hypothetical protein
MSKDLQYVVPGCERRGCALVLFKRPLNKRLIISLCPFAASAVHPWSTPSLSLSVSHRLTSCQTRGLIVRHRWLKPLRICLIMSETLEIKCLVTPVAPISTITVQAPNAEDLAALHERVLLLIHSLDLLRKQPEKHSPNLKVT